MNSWSVPGFPTMNDLVRLMQVQADIVSSLPDTVGELNRAVRRLAEVVEASHGTAETAQRVSVRVEELLDDLEDPLTGLRSGIERLSEVLNHPVVERIPAALEAIEETVLPIATSARRVRTRWARLRDAGMKARRRLGLAEPRNDTA